MMEREDETKVEEPTVIVTDIRPKRLEDAVKSAVSGVMACFYVGSWRQHEQEESIVRQEVMVSVHISVRKPKADRTLPMESAAHVPMLISSDYLAWLEKQWDIYRVEGQKLHEFERAEVDAARSAQMEKAREIVGSEEPLLLDTPAPEIGEEGDK